MSAVLSGYTAGSECFLPHSVRIKFQHALFDATRATLIARWAEFWCQRNCEYQWRVDGDHTHVDVFFEDEADLVLFKLSPDFDLN